MGTGKALSKLIVSLSKNRAKYANDLMAMVRAPFDIQHRTKSLSDINFWKAFDFKLFFFHIAPMVFASVPIRDSYFESFVTLSNAIRLLSKVVVHHNDIIEAESLLKVFFSNFVDLYGADSQSFNFHTMRHLFEQVRRNGPLWCFSAFCFESANHGLLSALQGTIKEPEAIVEQFIKHQASLEKFPLKQSEKCLKALTKVCENIKEFCGVEVDFFFSRFNHLGKRFASLSYTRINDNFSECIFQMRDQRFFRVDVFYSKSGDYYAVGKAAKVAHEFKPAPLSGAFGFFSSFLDLQTWKPSVPRNYSSKLLF